MKPAPHDEPSRLAHNAFEALGSIRSRLPRKADRRRASYMRLTKAMLFMMLEDLREIADEGMDLKSAEQTGSSKIYRIDLQPLDRP